MLPERAAREAIPVVPSELLELSGNASLELDSAALDWSASELLEYWGGTP